VVDEGEHAVVAVEALVGRRGRHCECVLLVCFVVRRGLLCCFVVLMRGLISSIWRGSFSSIY
jgi:hypothetical protein